MARQLVRSLYFLAVAVALVLQGCGKSSSGSLDRSVHPVAERAAAVDPPASPPVAHRSGMTSERLRAASAPLEQYPIEDPEPWLAELLQAPDPKVRIQALDAWARDPGPSHDLVTYALVDPDESVRARAQELFEEALARR